MESDELKTLVENDEAQVQTDNRLGQAETEVTLTATKENRQFAVYAEIPSIIRGLIRNDTFQTEAVRFQRHGTVELDDVTHDMVEEDDVVAIRGKLPLGALSVPKSARQNDNFNQIINYD